MILPGIYANTLLVLLNNRAAPSRSHLRADYVSSENQYASDGTSTANASSAAHWKTAGTATPTPLMGRFDYAASPVRRGYTPDSIPIGAFVAAPNALAEDARRARSGSSARPSLGQQRNLVSEWDDVSYKDGTRWDDRGTASLDLGDVEAREIFQLIHSHVTDSPSFAQSHPYGSAGTYTSWAR
jgi:hypothetical protein